MNEQFFGKPFRLVLAILAGTFGLSILVFNTAWTMPVLGLLAAGIFVLTVKRLEWGLVAAFAELFANSHGHLISAPLFGFSFSLREAVFLGVMAGWAWLLMRGRVSAPWQDARLTSFHPLFAAILLGFAVGFARHSFGVAFNDGNGYLYILYILPILSVSWTDETRRLLLQTLAAAAVWVSLVTLGLLYLFTHVPKWMLSAVYTFVRDTRTGELTEMGGIFRIFLQAQLSVVTLFIMLSVGPWMTRASGAIARRVVALGAFLWSVIVISLSRSFWLGLLAGGAMLLLLLIHGKKTNVKRAAAAIGWQGAAFLGSLLLLAAVIIVPPRTSSIGSLSSLLGSRTTDASDVAVSSRWNLLPEMAKQAFASPIVGSGFGQTVTFKTDDPRARAISPDGLWTTYTFEWGWLDLWLKMGFLGPLAFLVLFGAAWNGLKPLLSTDRAWLGMGLLASVAMLYATHILSPYLNHPLGIGLLLFTVPFWVEGKRRASEADASTIISTRPSVVPVLVADIE